ncbi:GNAT family N-acetyltransferase [Vibrio sp. Of7-15]|uniref:GNAT family N-acetyltransferase n=1 Tax=Vibrio sp. Of7-15 TaxID=2724879 RepID=UPI001EF39242|nr:GNAT family N-acetyltransferase [Vibrio sp. Of7-15]MCG7500196.1 GNAT family N-acetyltransferase [Vibrio sp. Of7-15]
MLTKNMKVKSVNQHCPDYRQLMDACFQPMREIYRVEKAEFDTGKKELQAWSCFGIEQKNKLVAGVEARVIDDVLHVKSLAVAKSARGERLSLHLISSVIAHFPNRAMNKLSLWCVAETGNVALFEKLGFKEHKREQSRLLRLANGYFATEVNMIKPIYRVQNNV